MHGMRARNIVKSFCHAQLERSMLHQMQDMLDEQDLMKFFDDFAILLPRHEHAFSFCLLYLFWFIYFFRIAYDLPFGNSLTFVDCARLFIELACVKYL